jgi:DNA-binding protein HU-beta
MNHKELISAISSKLSISKNEVEQMLDTTVSICTDQLKEGITIGFQSFGNFEVRKKEERLSVHPATQIRTLIPPKLVVNFKQSNVLKDKLNEI